jgi:hypothetical protein
VPHFIYRYAKCHYAECHYAECRYAEGRYAECRSAVNYAPSIIIMLLENIYGSNITRDNHHLRSLNFYSTGHRVEVARGA